MHNCIIKHLVILHIHDGDDPCVAITEQLHDQAVHQVTRCHEDAGGAGTDQSVLTRERNLHLILLKKYKVYNMR
jgi:hypothetical protein